MAITKFIIVFLLGFALASCNGKREKRTIGDISQVAKKLNETTSAHFITNNRQSASAGISKPRKLRAHNVLDVQGLNMVKPASIHGVNETTLDWTGGGYEFAGIVIQGSFNSVTAKMIVYKPGPVERNHISSVYIFIESGQGNTLNQIQAGWTVNPDRFHDGEAHLYTKYTMDNNKVCYNADCGEYKPIGRNKLGSVLKPSTVGHSPQEILEITLMQNPKSGRWHLSSLDFGDIGFWTGDNFSSLKGGATTIRFGGEVYTPNWSSSSPPMGSGNFENGNPSTTCYFSAIKVNQNTDPQNPQTTETRCYFAGDIGNNNHEFSGYGFFFGGTGGTDQETCFY